MNIYVYITAMALTTYLIRMLPLTIFRKPIRSRFLRSFLYYVPYACLTAMTFPAILTSAGTLAAGMQGVQDMPRLWQALAARGYPQALLEDLFWNNLRSIL